MSSGENENTGSEATPQWCIEQKENWPSDVIRKIPKTPNKHELTLQLVNCQGSGNMDRMATKPPCGEDEPWVTPKRKRSTSPWSTKAGTDPLTPTANLKMLISAASPEIRNREKRKVLFRCLENALEDESSEDTFFGEEFERSSGSRKEKSLGLLCLKFLARYPNYPASTSHYTISLDEVAAELSVERRRIYDIVNVLESLNLVSRTAKNRYAWHGRHKLPDTLAVLRQTAQQQDYASLANRFRDGAPETWMDIDSDARSQMELKRPLKSEFSSLQQDKRPKPSGGRKDKSLREMSKKFVMLFLVVKNNVVSLEMAAKVLQGGSPFDVRDNCKLKTKVRRLYDIANVLTSLNLIKKVQVMEDRGRKPAFQWIGPENLPELNEFSVNAVPVQLVTATACEAVGEVLSKKVPSPKTARRVPRDGFVRHSSFQTCRSVAEAEHRRISSAPCSPIKRNIDPCCLELSDLSRMDQLATICKLHLEAQPGEGVASQNLKKHAEPLTEAQPPTGKVGHAASVSQAQVVCSMNSMVGRVPEQNSSSSPPACESHKRPACGLRAQTTSQPKVKQPSLNQQAPSTAKIQASCENNMVFINGFQSVGYVNSLPFTSVSSINCPRESGQGKVNGLKVIPNQYYYISPPAGSHPLLAFCSPTLTGIRMQQGIQISPSTCSPLTLIKGPLSPQSSSEEMLKTLSPALQAQGQPFTIIMHSPQAGTPKNTHVPNVLVDHLFRTPGELRLGLAPAVPVRTGLGGPLSSRGEPSPIPQRRLNLDDS